MTFIPLLFAAVILSVIAWILTAELSRWGRSVFFIALATLLVISVTTTVEYLGWPKPVDVSWAERNVEEAAVLAASLHEGEAIYVWLRVEGSDAPRAYVLPWDVERAQELQEALSEAEANGTGVRMRSPFEATRDTNQPKFYAMPQEARPMKEPTAPPIEYVPNPEG